MSVEDIANQSNVVIETR